jgi:hypothetical protein
VTGLEREPELRSSVKLSFLLSLLKVALGMPPVAAFIQPAYIRYQGLGVPQLDFEGSNECVLGLYNQMAGVAEVLEANCELHLCFSPSLTASTFLVRCASQCSPCLS